MSFIKKVLFAIIPITTLIIFISYGIAIIFGENFDLTYIEQKVITITGSAGEIIEDKYYVFNFAEYLKNLASTNLTGPFINLANSVKTMYDPIKSIANLITNTHWWQLLIDPVIMVRILVNIFILLTDLGTFSINLAIAITQVANELLGGALKLVGINTEADVILFNIFRGFDDFTLLPTISALLW